MNLVVLQLILKMHSIINMYVHLVMAELSACAGTTIRRHHDNKIVVRRLRMSPVHTGTIGKYQNVLVSKTIRCFEVVEHLDILKKYS